MGDNDDYIYCTLCDYKVLSNRKDNFDRHMRQTHFKIKITCECGKVMNASSLSRHKTCYCPKRANTSSENPLDNESDASNSSSNEPVTLISSNMFKIETLICLDQFSDGTVKIVHEKINAGNISLTVSGKLEETECTNGN